MVKGHGGGTMSSNGEPAQIAPGMPVLSRDGVALGAVERFDGTQLQIPGWAIPVEGIARVADGIVHLRFRRDEFRDAESSTTAVPTEQLVIPLAEERLSVGTREVMIGEIVIRKRVVEEERMVPVIFRREEVEFVRLAPGEPLPAGWGADAGAQISRFPLHGWEPTFDKAPVVNREVRVTRAAQAEQDDVTATVRRERIEEIERTSRER